MAMTLFIIRHGATEGSEIKKYKGSIDVPLSAEGIIQIKSTSEFVAKWLHYTSISRKSSYLNELYPHLKQWGTNIDFIYSSSLSRAISSAEILANHFTPKPEVVALAEFRERNFGQWEGLSFAEIKQQYPDAFSRWASDPLHFSPPDGESTLEVANRTTSALLNILQKHSADNVNVAIVAHGGVNRILLCHILGIPLQNIFRIEQDFACVNIIEYWEGNPVIKLLNWQLSCESFTQIAS